MGLRKKKSGVAAHHPSHSYEMINKITGQFAFILKKSE